MRRLILGTAGHIDHGKTTLVRALTGVDTDRLLEEKRRGITIDLGFAKLSFGDDLTIGIVDLPGHEAFIRNMLAGATGVDLALIVIAADEGVMPQTREHLAILELLGVRTGIIAISKVDLVDPEWLELVNADLDDHLGGTPFSDLPRIPVSASTGAGVEELRQELKTAAMQVVSREGRDLFRLPVDRVFPVHGTGTVVTGTIWSGQIERDQRADLLPLGERVRVRSIQVHGKEVDQASAGERAALALVGVDRERISRGEVLVTGDGWRRSMILTADLRLLEGAPSPLISRTRVRFHLGTAEVMARLVPLQTSSIEAGERAIVQLRLESPVVARSGDRFIIRSYSPITTIGGGTIIEPSARKRRRLSSRRVARLLNSIITSPLPALQSLADEAGWQGFDLSNSSIATPFSPDEIESAINEILSGIDLETGPPWTDGPLIIIQDMVFQTSITLDAYDLALKRVDLFHQEQPLRAGLDRETIRRALPPGTAPVLGEWIIERLLQAGVVEASGALIRRAGYRPVLNTEQIEIRDRLVQLLSSAGLTPPTISALPPELRDHHDLRQILRILEEEGQIVALDSDLYLDSEHLEKAIGEMRRELAGRGPLSAPEFRDVIPLSRKYLIPILEYLDRRGITNRSGDLRTFS